MKYCLIVLTLIGGVISAAETTPDMVNFKKSIKPLIEKYCLDCHDEDVQKGDVRMDNIDPNIVSGKDYVLWEEAFDRVVIGEMPPTKKKSTPQPSEEERKLITDWIKRELQKHLVHKVGVPGRVVMRRLSREEYGNTLKDLLGINENLGHMLMPDTSYKGFDHVAAVQELSPSQISNYISAARRVIDLVICDEPRPITASYKIYPYAKKKPPEWQILLHGEEVNKAAWPDMKNDKKPKHLRLNLPKNPDIWEKMTRGSFVRLAVSNPDGDGALLASAREAFKGNWGYVGVYLPYAQQNVDLVRLRIKAGGVAVNNGKTKPIMSIHLWKKLYGHFEVDAPKDKPQWYEFIISPRNLLSLQAKIKDDPRFHKRKETTITINNGYELPGVKPGHKYSAIPKEVEMPDLYIEEIQVDYGYQESWPTAQQKSLLGDVSKITDPHKHAKAVLSRFMSRAYRRPVRADELVGKMKLFDRAYAQSKSFLTAIKEPLVATLVSPHFIFISEDKSVDEKKRRKLGAYELASRLSYFAWRTMPDEELMKAAKDGSLLKPAVKEAQLKRLLTDDRAEAFYRSFTTQWLHLDKLDEQMIEDYRWLKSYQLPDAMKGETISFLKTLVNENLSLLNLINSDFAMLNERLAHHYKIPGVHGNHYRKVALKPDYHRGGLITQASIMTVTTDAMITNPIYRGVYMLEKIMDMPPPEAPANVPPLEDAPKERLSLREQFKKHREDENCASCHKRIDPIGWPFENYSIMGEFSTQAWGPNWSEYHTTKHRKGKKHDQTPDLHGILPNGKRVNSVQDLQKAMLESNREDIVRSITKHLMIYALGRPLDISDEAVVEEIIKEVVKNKYSTRALISAVINSKPFLEK